MKLNFIANSQDKDDYNSDTEYPVEVKERAILWGIKPGVEFKFLEHTRIQPYTVFGLFFYDNISWSEHTNYDRSGSYNNGEYIYNYTKVEKDIDGGWIGTTPSEYHINGHTYNSTVTIYGVERGYIMFGANAFLGADYYLTYI